MAEQPGHRCENPDAGDLPVCVLMFGAVVGLALLQPQSLLSWKGAFASAHPSGERNQSQGQTQRWAARLMSVTDNILWKDLTNMALCAQ